MKRVIFLMLIVGMLAATGCKTTQGTAEVITKDNTKWVHVHGTDIRFPLIGVWKDAQVTHIIKEGKFAKTRLTVVEFDGSVSDIGIYAPLAYPTEEPFTRNYTKSIGLSKCDQMGYLHNASGWVGDEGVYYSCITKMGRLKNLSRFPISSTNEFRCTYTNFALTNDTPYEDFREMNWRVKVNTKRQSYQDYQEMMRRVVLH